MRVPCQVIGLRSYSKKESRVILKWILQCIDTFSIRVLIKCWNILTSWVSLPVVISLSSSALPSQSLSTRSPLKPKVWLHFWNKYVRERMRYLALIFFCSKIYVWKMYLWTQFENCLRFGGKRLFEILWLSFVIRDLKKIWLVLTHTLVRNDFGGIVTDNSLLSRSSTRKDLLGWETCTIGPNNLPIWKVKPT